MQSAPALPIVPHEGEPRVLDVDLAASLGFARPVKVRDLIRRHSRSLTALGVLPTVGITPGHTGGRPSQAYYLNKKQAIFVTAKSETPKAIEVTLAIIERFDAYERAALPAADPTHALSMVREARETFGAAAARRVWINLGLPAGPEMLAMAEPRQAKQPEPASAPAPWPKPRSSVGNPSPEVMARIQARVAAGETMASAFRAEGASYGAWRKASYRRRIRACGTSLT